MHLSAHVDSATATASWTDAASLLADFEADGILTGESTAEIPAPKTTVDAALATTFDLAPGAEKTITFVLSWHFPGGDFGLETNPPFAKQKELVWFFENGGSHYENWWANATEVDAYVAENLDYLDTTTRLYHQTVYSSNIPRFALDRMTSNLLISA